MAVYLDGIGEGSPGVPGWYEYVPGEGGGYKLVAGPGEVLVEGGEGGSYVVSTVLRRMPWSAQWFNGSNAYTPAELLANMIASQRGLYLEILLLGDWRADPSGYLARAAVKKGRAWVDEKSVEVFGEPYFGRMEHVGTVYLPEPKDDNGLGEFLGVVATFAGLMFGAGAISSAVTSAGGTVTASATAAGAAEAAAAASVAEVGAVAAAGSTVAEVAALEGALAATPAAAEAGAVVAGTGATATVSGAELAALVEAGTVGVEGAALEAAAISGGSVTYSTATGAILSTTAGSAGGVISRIADKAIATVQTKAAQLAQGALASILQSDDMPAPQPSAPQGGGLWLLALLGLGVALAA